jgi:diguanylate cyclase (GGDEF)-like protein/PAS domain S-box-containing protein
VTLFTLLIFVIGTWLLSFYAGRALHEDMQRELGQQQLATTTLLAAQINNGFKERLAALEIVAAGISADNLEDITSLQALLNDRPIFLRYFNAGVYVTKLDGTAIVSVPAPTKRVGVNYLDRDYIATPLKSGKSTIGRPVIGRVLHSPVFGIGMPIKDNDGMVIGVLAGVIDLGKPSFLDNVIESHYGKSGYFLLQNPQDRVIILSTDKRRIMQPQLPPGINPLIDRQLQGVEETGVTVNSLGQEVLSSAKRIPEAGWILVASLPTLEAFAPIHSMQQRIMLAALLMTLLAGGLIWWMLRRELSPMFATVKQLTLLSGSGEHTQPLMIDSQNEIGDLIAAFNGLLAELGQREEALKESEFRWKFAIEGSGDGLWDWDVSAGKVFYSPTWKALLGYSEQDIAGDLHEWRERIHADDKLRALAMMQEHLDGQTRTYASEYRVLCKDGSYKWILDRGLVVSRNAANVPLRVIGTFSDISGRKAAEDSLLIAAAVFESQEGMIVADPNGLILRVNNAFTKISGYSADEVVGKAPKVLSSGLHDKSFYDDMWESINRKGTWEGEVWNRRKNGQAYLEYLIITAVKDNSAKVTNYVATMTDITMRKEASDEIHNLAFYDPLTQLPNRRLLLDRLKHALVASARSGRRGAVLFLDLDHFKTLNDTLGHDMGDLLLQQVSVRLAECVRKVDTVARIGGDEFVVLLEDLSDQAIEAATQTEIVAAKVLASLSKPFHIGTHEHHSTGSIGATLFFDHEAGVEAILKQADIAMYQAKDSGRNAIRFFDQNMQEAVTERANLEHELRVALSHEQFELFFQAQVDNAGQALGAEALIRWRHPERGTVLPGYFIRLAEDTGLILPIGQWVLNAACAQLKRWQAHVHTSNLSLSVNVSAKQFRQVNFVEQVQAAVKLHAVDPKLLKLELTESMLFKDVNAMIATMNSLREIGIRFELDDFGTGYSSLQYLKKLPLCQLKIDQTFVRDIAVDSNDRTLVLTIITMAHSLGLQVIAEGVETEEQLEFLKNNGCDHYQGYLFGRPLPIDEFEAALRQT